MFSTVLNLAAKIALPEEMESNIYYSFYMFIEICTMHMISEMRIIKHVLK